MFRVLVRGLAAGLTAVTTAVVSSAYARVIPPCETLLAGVKDTLAQIELENFEVLRVRLPVAHRMVRGLLFEVYARSLRDQALALGRAYAFVPGHRGTAMKYVTLAAETGLLTVTHTPGRLQKYVRPGPKLVAYVQTLFDLSLDRVHRDAGQLPLRPVPDVGKPSRPRTAALDGLLLKMLRHEYDRVWRPREGEAGQLDLRHTYGFLLHLYQMHLRQRPVNLIAARRRIPVEHDPARVRARDALVGQGLAVITTVRTHPLTRHIGITALGIRYVEGHLARAVDDANAILAAARAERE